MTLYGTREMSSGTCMYTLDARLIGELSGDALSGRIDYSYRTNLAVECGYRNDCRTTALFSGSRPPR